MTTFAKWLHDAGYKFTGETRIADLTPQELTILRCGYLVEQQEREDQRRDQQTRSSGHSKSRNATRRYVEQHQQQHTQQATDA